MEVIVVDGVPCRKVELKSVVRQDQFAKAPFQFVKGPLPLDWFGRAGALPGKAVAIGLVVWYVAGLEGRRDALNITNAAVGRLGVSHKAKSSGLKALEDAGLVKVERRGNKNPLVTILDVPKDG